MATTVLAGTVPRTDRRAAFDLRAAEISAWSGLLRELTLEDWRRPTVCDRWKVHDIVGHLCGHAEEILRPWLFVWRDRAAARRHPKLTKIDAHMEVQVEAHRKRNLSPHQLAERFDRLWPRANCALRRVPLPVRRVRLSTGGAPGLPTLGLDYLHDIIYLRDLWMHRDDVCQATSHSFAIGPHDMHVVAQVLRDLDAGWTGPAVMLELTGSLGGSWQVGPGTPTARARLDALDYMRTLSGRNDTPAVELLAGGPSIRETVRSARVPF